MPNEPKTDPDVHWPIYTGPEGDVKAFRIAKINHRGTHIHLYPENPDILWAIDSRPEDRCFCTGGSDLPSFRLKEGDYAGIDPDPKLRKDHNGDTMHGWYNYWKYWRREDFEREHKLKTEFK